VQRHDLHVVPRGRIHFRSTGDQYARGFDVAEEAREAERLKAVVSPRVRERRILVQELAQTLVSTGGRGFEHVELRVRRQQLVGSRLVAGVDGP
jgi:hypothetical protein